MNGVSKTTGAVIFRQTEGDSREFLLVKGKNKEWGFAKGNTEGEETERETATREIYEEVRVRVDFVEGFREVYTYKLRVKTFGFFKKNIKKEVVIFLAKIKEDAPIKLQKSELLDYGWFSYSDGYEILNFKERKKIIKKAEKFLKDTMI